MLFQFNNENFTYLISILDAISKHCSDCEITKGKIIIRSDNKVLVYQIELPEFFQNFDLAINSTTNFIELLKIFIPEDDQYVDFDIQENNIIIKDRWTNINLNKVSTETLQNQNIFDKLNEMNFFNRQEIFSAKIPENIVQRIKVINKNFGVTVMKLSIDESKNIGLSIISDSKTKQANFNLEDLNFNYDMNPGSYIITCSILDFPFENVFMKISSLQNETLVVTIHDENNLNQIHSALLPEEIV